MLLRIITFLLVSLVGSVFTWFLAGPQFAAWGLFAGAFVWCIRDALNANAFERGLRHVQSTQEAMPELNGWWGELADRLRRIVRTQSELAKLSDQRLQDFLAAIQASPNGLLLLDAENRIEWCNQTAAGQLGLDAQRDLKQQIGNLVRSPDFSAYLASERYSQELVLQGATSTTQRPSKLSIQLHPYSGLRKLMLIRDVTALEQAEAMRRDFVANVSHEIRTPLTVLAGFVETLQNLSLDESQRNRYLGMMAQQSMRMQSLVSDLLTLSKLEGSPLPAVGESHAVSSMMVQCEHDARALSQTLSSQQHRISFDCASDTLIYGVRNELFSAMSNLVQNAVRYTPPGGKIEVRWHVLRDGRGEFSVTDSGPGIAQEHLSRLTERFYRVDRSRSRDTGGTGLGLAIVKHVVQRHGGDLRIESAVGQGSTFAFTLPSQRVVLQEPHYI